MTATKVTVQPTAESYTNPSTRPAQVSALISSVDRYNPSNCHLLEDYLQDQLSSSSYDLLPNLALLKLYQFNPTLLSPSSVLSILFLSLVHAPFSPDFSLAWSLLGDSFIVGANLPPLPQNDDDDDDDEDDVAHLGVAREPAGERELAQELKKLSQLLQGRKFRSFWKELRDGLGEGPEGKLEDEVKASAVGYEERLREVIAAEVEASFKGIEKKMLESFLGLEASSEVLEPLIKSRGWTLHNNGVVHIPANESNSPTSTLQRERIEITQLAKLLERSQAN